MTDSGEIPPVGFLNKRYEILDILGDNLTSRNPTGGIFKQEI